MLIFGCLLAIGAAVAPRLILIFAALFGRRWDVVWQGDWVLPMLGIIFLPYTTIMYLLVWSPAGLVGFDWVWLGLGVLLDVMKWSQIARNREGIPGVKSSQSFTGVDRPQDHEAPAAPPASAAPPAAAAAPEPSELEKLAKLRDDGVITEEEYQAKKDQISGT